MQHHGISRWISLKSDELPSPESTQVTPAVIEMVSEVEVVADDVELMEGDGALAFSPSTSLARRGAVEALTVALTRSLDRSNEAIGMQIQELEAIGEMLDVEIDCEEKRLAELKELIQKIGSVMKEKGNTIEKETELLNKIQEIKAQTIERVIQEKLDDAATSKAELISIEMVLCETMESCKGQIEAEAEVVAARLESTKSARATLPDSSDIVAVRAYGFQELVDLQDAVLKTQKAVALSEQQVGVLRAKIKTAMTQRNALLGAQSTKQLEEAAAVEAAAKREKDKVVAEGLAAREKAMRAAKAASAAPRSAAAAPKSTPAFGRTSSAARTAEPNEVELAQAGAAKAGSALFGIGSALAKAAKGEGGVGETLRAVASDVGESVTSLGKAGVKLIDRK